MKAIIRQDTLTINDIIEIAKELKKTNPGT